jgi:hypothetical protein
MNRFGEIADELTELMEELDHPDLAPDAKRLLAALERAFARACEAERALRLRHEAQPLVRRARAARSAAAPALSAQVIELPRAWRPRPAAQARRLND